LINNVFDFRPSSIKKEIGVYNFFEFASYGHAGVLGDKLPWERLDRVDILKELANDY
jgi:S-adenosylmethionine synthetase